MERDRGWDGGGGRVNLDKATGSISGQSVSGSGYPSATMRGRRGCGY
ncbi:MAG: hypothetical protein ACPIOQ_53385 [Promethearchaeia archaeon]